MANHNFDLTVIGSGPGGYVAAIRASQLGMKVGLVEKENVGGVCLNWGCIPTKALLKSAEVFHTLNRSKEFGINVESISYDFPAIIQRSRRIALRLSKGVEFLCKKNNIPVIKGHGKLISPTKIAILDEQGNEQSTIQTKNVIIATGARPRSIPNIHFDNNKIITSKEAMALNSIPESMAIIGAGAIGVEFAYFYHTLGCKISIIEMLPRILPNEDQEITQILTNSFKKNKIGIYTDSIVKSISHTEKGVNISFVQNDEDKQIQAEIALIAIGVQGNIENLGLEEIGVQTEKGWIKVNKNYSTNIPNIYAIGDIIGPPWLAHVASAEGVFAAENITENSDKSVNYENIPGCTYCQPQVASIGLTEQQATEKGYKLKIGRFPFQANGKSIALGENQGMVKLIYNSENNNLLGAHIIHAEATELINELSVVKQNHIIGHNLINSIHAHPTLSEAIMEAAAAAYDEAIHI